LSVLQDAKNSILKIDGIDIVKSSNSITDAIEGVTLNLVGLTSGSALNLSVASNQDAIKTSVTSFVDAFNKLDTTLRNLTKFDETGQANGALLGDSTARSVINQIRAVMNTAIANGSSINSLTQIGVTFQRDGKLSLDSTKFASAVSSNFNDIASLFAATARATDPQVSFVSSTSKTKEGTYAISVTQLGSTLLNAQGTINGATATGSSTTLRGALGDDSEGLTINVAGGALGARGTVNFSQGYAAKLSTLLDSLLSDDGILAARTDGINSSIKRLDTQTERITSRLTAIEDRYRAQYARLDVLLTSMSSTSTFLTQQIAALNAK